MSEVSSVIKDNIVVEEVRNSVELINQRSEENAIPGGEPDFERDLGLDVNGESVDRSINFGSPLNPNTTPNAMRMNSALIPIISQNLPSKGDGTVGGMNSRRRHGSLAIDYQAHKSCNDLLSQAREDDDMIT